MILVFGCRQSKIDHIYREETLQAKNKGVFRELYTAYSREPDKPKVSPTRAHTPSGIHVLRTVSRASPTFDLSDSPQYFRKPEKESICISFPLAGAKMPDTHNFKKVGSWFQRVQSLVCWLQGRSMMVKSYGGGNLPPSWQMGSRRRGGERKSQRERKSPEQDLAFNHASPSPSSAGALSPNSPPS